MRTGDELMADRMDYPGNCRSRRPLETVRYLLAYTTGHEWSCYWTGRKRLPRFPPGLPAIQIRTTRRLRCPGVCDGYAESPLRWTVLRYYAERDGNALPAGKMSTERTGPERALTTEAV